MNKIKFKIAAKTDVGLERSNNEDNFQASSDLQITPMRWINNEICQLGDKGALLVVADGMGGMNAGEVASQIAIDTVREEFAPTNITPEITKSRYTIEKYMNEVVIKADAKIKDVSKKRPETRGMGTTIVIAWLYNEHLYVSWCGDSRAYVFNPEHGLHRLTKDHSYVQQLVDAGKLTEDEAFDFPDSNIITRCLCDGRQKAQPECLDNPYPVCDNDIILLCTDGLCGMIRDFEIQEVMISFTKDMTILTDNLVQAALNASGADNCTVCICQIISGGKKNAGNYFSEKKPKGLIGKCDMILGNSHRKIKLSFIVSLFVGLIGFASWYLYHGKCASKQQCSATTDSIVHQNDLHEEETLAEEQKTDDHTRDIEKPQITNDKKQGDMNSNLEGLSIPKTDGKSIEKKGDAESTSVGLTQNTKSDKNDNSVEEVREVVVEKLPEGVSLQQFAQQHGMNYLDMRRLNPNIQNWRAVQPGTSLNVYKK